MNRIASARGKNLYFLSYWFAAAWIVLTIYVLTMAGREGRLKLEIANLKAMLKRTAEEVTRFSKLPNAGDASASMPAGRGRSA